MHLMLLPTHIKHLPLCKTGSGCIWFTLISSAFILTEFLSFSQLPVELYQWHLLKPTRGIKQDISSFTYIKKIDSGNIWNAQTYCKQVDIMDGKIFLLFMPLYLRLWPMILWSLSLIFFYADEESALKLVRILLCLNPLWFFNTIIRLILMLLGSKLIFHHDTTYGESYSFLLMDAQ